MATADGKAPFYKKWWFWLIVVVVIIGVAGAGASRKPDEHGDVEEETVTTESAEGIAAKPKALDADIIENECTDAKYGINRDGFSPIYILDYNFQTYDYAYTEDGNIITLAEWNGKHDDKKVIFHCYISGNDNGDAEVYWISADGVDLWKDEGTLNFFSYDKNGNPMYPDLNPAGE